MKTKGLCETCVNDKKCAFLRKFPVVQCEEFSDEEPIMRAAKDRGVPRERIRRVREAH